MLAIPSHPLVAIPVVGEIRENAMSQFPSDLADTYLEARERMASGTERERERLPGPRNQVQP